MQEILRKYAKYNKTTNTTMNTIIDSSKRHIRLLNANGYYKNIGEMLIHILDVDIYWLAILKNKIPDSALRSDIIREMSENESNRIFFDISTYQKYRIETDKILEQLSEELSEDDLKKDISYTGKGNIEKKKKIWEILIHIYNHQTHHRGQISQILDEHGIENDYSNIIRIE